MPIARKRTEQGKDFAIPILMYHSISDRAETGVHPYFWVNTTVDRFNAQMMFLKENQYDVMSLSRAVAMLQDAGHESGERPSRFVAITFDDGFRDFHFNAFPVLQKHGFTATVFLPTEYITDHTRKMTDKEHLSWNEVFELQKQGISFGSHTVNHLQLKGINRKDVLFQIENSKKIIEDRIGASVESFSYPFAFPEEDKDLTLYLTNVLTDCGYKYGVSTRIGRATATDPVFFIKRLPVNSRDDDAFFRAKLEGGYDWMHKIQLASKIVRAKFQNGKNED